MENYDFVFKSIRNWWFLGLFLVFSRPVIEYIFNPSKGFWINFYSFGVSSLIVYWFMILARYRDQDQKEKFEKYRIKKRMQEAMDQAKKSFDQNSQ